MDDIYLLSDKTIMNRIGERIKVVRLKQNITQQSLAEESGLSLSSVKKIEKGEVGAFDSLLRIMRTLGMLDLFQPMMEEKQLSPNEYYEFVHSAGKKLRKRAVNKLKHWGKEESEW